MMNSQGQIVAMDVVTTGQTWWLDSRFTVNGARVVVVKKWDPEFWLVVPICHASIPRSSGELLVGTYVFSCWNVISVPEKILKKGKLCSYMTFDEKAVANIFSVVANSMTGKPIYPCLQEFVGLPITDPNSPVLKEQANEIKNLDKLHWMIIDYIEKEE